MDSSPSYQKSFDGNDCPMLGTGQGICWGEVDIVDEQCTEDYFDCWGYYACEGHAEIYNYGGKYRKEEE